MHATHSPGGVSRARFLRCWGTAAILAVTAGCGDPLTVETEPAATSAMGIVDDLQALGLETLPAPIRTVYSPGYAERAAMLQAWLRDADDFFRKRLKVSPEFSLLVLSPEHWSVVSPGPYGVPFVNLAQGLVVMPAVPGQAVVTQVYTASRPGLPSHAEAQLAALGISYEDAVLQVLDLIGFHEVGHIYIAALGYHPGNTARWLEEMLATYAAYSYLDVAQPSAIVVWDALSEALLNFVQPATRSLDEFNDRPLQRFGPATYGWFQSHFNLRSTLLVKHRPRATWFAQLHGTGLDRDTRAVPTSQLLNRLRGFNPSFIDWADAAGLEYE